MPKGRENAKSLSLPHCTVPSTTYAHALQETRVEKQWSIGKTPDFMLSERRRKNRVTSCVKPNGHNLPTPSQLIPEPFQLGHQYAPKGHTLWVPGIMWKPPPLYLDSSLADCREENQVPPQVDRHSYDFLSLEKEISAKTLCNQSYKQERLLAMDALSMTACFT